MSTAINKISTPKVPVLEQEKLLLINRATAYSNFASNSYFATSAGGDDFCTVKIFADDQLIETLQGIPFSTYADSTDTNRRLIGLEVNNILTNNGYTTGTYRLDFTFNRALVGSPLTDKLFLKRISQSKKELRLRPRDILNAQGSFNNQLANSLLNYAARFNVMQGNEQSNIWHNISKVNFESGQSINIVNVVQSPITTEEDSSGEHDIVVKLDRPIPREIKVDTPCWITKTMVNPVSCNVTLFDSTVVTLTYNEIGKPNFFVEVNPDDPSPTTDLKSTDELLDAVPDTRERLLNEIFSGSLGGAELPIDYSQYENFIHFSSAEQRLRNFYYKVQLIENYDSQIASFSTDYTFGNFTASGAPSVTASAQHIIDKAFYENKKNELLGTFDGFEKYMYYESGSFVTNSFGEFPDLCWPKSTTSKPHALLPTTSSQVINWYGELGSAQLGTSGTGALYSASLYDTTNPHALFHIIPKHVFDDELNSDYVDFVNMVSQLYDVLYYYIDNLDQLYGRDERLNAEISKDLVYDALKSFGWKPQQGFNMEDLWTYFLGTNESGSFNQTTDSSEMTSITFGDNASLPRSEIVKETWNRVLNNLPHLQRTRGTKRGLQALFNIYGIPRTLLEVREYGGPDTVKQDGVKTNELFEFEKYNYALTLHGYSNFADFLGSDPTLTRAHAQAYVVHEGWDYKSGSMGDNNIPQGAEGWPHTTEIRFKTTSSNYVNYEGETNFINLFGLNHDAMEFAALPVTGSSQALAVIAGTAPELIHPVGWQVNIERTGSISGSSDWARINLVITGSEADMQTSSSRTTQISASTEYLPLLNGDWWNVALITSEPTGDDHHTGSVSQTWTLHAKQASDYDGGSIRHSGSFVLQSPTGSASASYNRSWIGGGDGRGNFLGIGSQAATGSLMIGVDGPRAFNGSLHDSNSPGIWQTQDFTGTQPADSLFKQTYLSRAQATASGLLYAVENSTYLQDELDTGLAGSGSAPFSGSIQEFRLWYEPLTEDVVEAHTLSPVSIVGNSYTSSYNTLVSRYPLGSDQTSIARASQSFHLSDFEEGLLLKVHNIAPNQNATYTGVDMFETSGGSNTGFVNAPLQSITGSTTFAKDKILQPNSEVFYTRIPDIIGSRETANKIRIENNSTVGNLSPIFTGVSVQSSSHDTNPVDSPRLSIALSPTQQLDRDIAFQFGGLSFDDFVGDPSDFDKSQYASLEALSNHYFKKYTGNGYNAHAFIRMLKFMDLSLFRQIDRMIPARANSFVGLVIEPTVLERPKLARKSQSFSEENYTHPVSKSSETRYESGIDSLPGFDKYLSSSADRTEIVHSASLASGLDVGSLEYGSLVSNTITYKLDSAMGTGSYDIRANGSYYKGLPNERHFDPIGINISSSRLSEDFGVETENRFYSSDADAAIDNASSSSFSPAEYNDHSRISFKKPFYEGTQMFSQLITFATNSGTQSIYNTFPKPADSGSTYDNSSDTYEKYPVIEVIIQESNTITVADPGGNLIQLPSRGDNSQYVAVSATFVNQMGDVVSSANAVRDTDAVTTVSNVSIVNQNTGPAAAPAATTAVQTGGGGMYGG